MSITSVVNDTVTSESVINALKPLPPTISGYSVGGLDDTALDPAGGQTVQINGTGFLAGATITFDGSAVAVVTYVNPNRLTFTSPAKSAGTYTIYVVNPDSGTAIFIPGIIYSVLPTWTTSAGTLGSYYETTSISNTVVASGDAPITYSLYSGSLPTGSTLYANGVITGTAPVDSSSTTYSFTIEAIDAQLQGSTRSFSLTINVDAVTWVSPAAGTTYTSAVDSAIANVVLSATDATGYAVSYSANALPTGLSLSGANISGTPTVIADSSTLLTATAATTNRTATRTINWSITVANDPYFEYNTLLIPGASTTFVDDASTNNFAVSIFGDTKPNNFNPYTPGYYSGYFDGTGDYLSLPSNSAFTLGTGDFTIELWYNSSVSYASGNSYIFDMGTNGTRIQLFQNSVYFIPQTGNSIQTSAGVGMSVGVWTHIAAVRNGSTMTLYINGTSVGSVTNSNNLTDMLFKIGDYGAGGYGFNGYISNVRLVKGNAVYTTNFTPPTTPLTAIANTSLLTCQSNRFIDNSTNNFTLTVNGNTTISSFDPFVPNTSYSTYGSGYFDGTGDYLTVPNNTSLGMGSGNFTIEFWVYQTSLVSFRQILDVVDGNSVGRLILWVDSAGTLYNLGQNGNARNTTAAGAITTNTWIHVALVRSSGTTKFYINGTQSGSNYTDSTTYTCTTGSVYIGINSDGGTYPYQGYLTDFRMVKGTAVYTTAFTPPAAPLTAISGTSLLTLQNNQSVNNNVFLDNSTNNFFVTRNGNTTQGTFSPYGGNWSNYFNGTTGYLTVPINTAINPGTGDFTFECWAYASAAVGYSSIFEGMTNGLSITFNNGKVAIAYSGVSYLITDASNFTLNQWVHIATSRSGTSLSLFVGGVRVGNATNSTNFVTSTENRIGRDANNTYFTGYISNLRIVKGTAVYSPSSTTITVPTTPLTPITNTSLLTCADNRIVDDSINNFTITKNGDVSVQRYSPFNPSSLTATSYSGYFDGTGDYLSAASSSAFNVGTNSFCIEFWIYTSGFPSGGVADGIVSAGYSTNVHVLGFNVTGFRFYVVGSFVDSTTAINLNAWNHVAFVRNGTTGTIYVNGVASGTGTLSGTGANSALYVGTSSHDLTETFTGYLSNVRFVNGSAVYTSNFTPSTTPLTAISGTSLLTCQSPTFIDNSTNNFTISAFGNSQPTQQNPFGFTSATTNGYTVSTIGGSGYFDGTGDYLTSTSNAAYQFGTGDFTIEYWIYQTASGSYRTVLDTRASGTASPWACLINSSNQPYILITSDLTSSIAITMNAWNHVAIVRSGTNLSIYVNGVSGLSTTNSTSISPTGSLRVGLTVDNVYPMLGYLTDIRIAKSTALYKANFVPPSAPLTAVQNTVLLNNMTSAGIYDAAMMNNMETVGDAKLSTAVSKFGGSSMFLNGTTADYLTYSSSTYISGTEDFTIEGWIYLSNITTNATKVIIGGATNNALGFRVGQSFNNNVQALGIYKSNVSDNDYALFTFAANTWYHVAVTRSGSTIRFFVNGTQGTTQGTSVGAFSFAAPSSVRVGIGQTSDEPFAGYIDDLRVTKGVARYTSNFTPPTTAFPVY